MGREGRKEGDMDKRNEGSRRGDIRRKEWRKKVDEETVDRQKTENRNAMARFGTGCICYIEKKVGGAKCLSNKDTHRDFLQHVILLSVKSS